MNQQEWLEAYYPQMFFGATEPIPCAICGEMTTTSPSVVRQFYTCSADCESRLQEEYASGSRQRW